MRRLPLLERQARSRPFLLLRRLSSTEAFPLSPLDFTEFYSNRLAGGPLGLPSLAEDVGVHFSRLARGINTSFLLAPGPLSAEDVTLGVLLRNASSRRGLLQGWLFRSRLAWLERREGEGGGGELGSDTDTFGYIDFFSVNYRDVHYWSSSHFRPSIGHECCTFF